MTDKEAAQMLLQFMEQAQERLMDVSFDGLILLMLFTLFVNHLSQDVPIAAQAIERALDDVIKFFENARDMQSKGFDIPSDVASESADECIARVNAIREKLADLAAQHLAKVQAEAAA